ncbi:MAG: LysM peptidoglycan-binding domain-containing protein [Nostocales cyanobacterium]|nr:MAG: LysM peptidoglycan-binding domain-containing protein [Nostocales cyanobacterium]
MVHTVKAGDTLFSVARQYGVGVDQIRTWNTLRSDSLALGQQLRVAPAGGTPAAAPRPTVASTPTPSANPTTVAPQYQAIAAARQAFKAQAANMGTYNQYTLTFPMPTGGTGTATFRDNINSSFALYKDGIMYPGRSSPKNVPLDAYLSVGLTPTLAKALKVVSENEGNFDAINSYDKAIFSYGFIQFAGGSLGGQSLNQLLMNIKQRDPNVFRVLFGQYGIDVQPRTPRPMLTVASPEQGRVLNDDEGWTAIKNDKRLTALFVAAGFHPTVMVAQIQSAVQGYVNPALGIKLTLTVGGQTFANVPVKDIIRTEAATATLIDLTVNQWITRTGQFFQQAIQQVAAARGLSTLQQLAGIDERAVLQTIVNNATDSRVRDRTNKMMNSGLSLAK